MLKVVKNKDLIWDVDDYDVILIGTSIYCQLGAGIQSKIKFKYPIVAECNNKTKYGDLTKIGKRLTVQTKPIISLMYICGFPNTKRIFIDYDALEHCLTTAMMEFKGKRIATTILGSSLFDGNGDKDKCLEIIERCCDGCDVTVYDYVQKKTSDEREEERRKFLGTDKKPFMGAHTKRGGRVKEEINEHLKKLYLR